MRKRRERITKGFAAVDDRTVWTLELNRDELMIILNGIKNHRIKGARMKLRIAQKSYTIYKMSPRTTARIMAARHIGKGSDGSKACIVAMAHSIALAVAGSKSIFADLKAWFICRRIMKRASFAELFDCYQKTLMMIPLEDISAVASVISGLAETVAKDAK